MEEESAMRKMLDWKREREEFWRAEKAAAEAEEAAEKKKSSEAAAAVVKKKQKAPANTDKHQQSVAKLFEKAQQEAEKAVATVSDTLKRAREKQHSGGGEVLNANSSLRSLEVARSALNAARIAIERAATKVAMFRRAEVPEAPAAVPRREEVLERWSGELDGGKCGEEMVLPATRSALAQERWDALPGAVEAAMKQLRRALSDSSSAPPRGSAAAALESAADDGDDGDDGDDDGGVNLKSALGVMPKRHHGLFAGKLFAARSAIPLPAEMRAMAAEEMEVMLVADVLGRAMLRVRRAAEMLREWGSGEGGIIPRRNADLPSLTLACDCDFFASRQPLLLSAATLLTSSEKRKETLTVGNVVQRFFRAITYLNQKSGQQKVRAAATVCSSQQAAEFP